ncbi:cytochrome P450 [Diaporthe sp. PMI_573]|nr:cytochrome P450 [Diaporthaceae sp. PMI_573]KAH8759474.1 cytochrome P450 [Diaporthaceae sp. PMI_573]
MAEFVNTGPHSSDAFWQLMKLPRQHDDGVIQVTSKTLLTVACLVVSYYTFSAIHSLLFSPLKNVPGPFLARITHWFEYFMVQRGDSNLEYVRLHKKYGPVVRVGPNRYSISLPSGVKTIYELGGKYSKSDFYKPAQLREPDRQNIFAIQDNDLHKDRRRKISSLYTMSSMVSYEKAVDEMTRLCIRKMHQYAEQGRLINIPQWMQYYAFDVIGEITFNKSFGMMENERDVPGMIPGIHSANDSLGYFGVIPSLVPWVIDLPAALGRLPGAVVVGKYAIDTITASRESNAEVTKKGDAVYQTFLKKVLDMEAQGRLKMPNIMDACGGNIAAGSDTTGVTLSAALYYLYTNRDTLQRLRKEIDTQAAAGHVSDPVTFQEAQALPYLQAVIKEVLRLHPAVGTILPRFVPKGGLELSGYYFPPGTEIGVNAWVLHQNKDVYGPDPETFRPERWIGEEKTSLMESMMFAFGGGSRTCIGRNISLLEITKVVPQIVRNFDVQFEHPGKPMETRCAWFVYPKYNGFFKVRASE